MVYQCKKCNATFKSEYTLTKHLNKDVSCDKMLVCNRCGMSFNKISIYERHLNRKLVCEKRNLTENKSQVDMEIIQAQLELAKINLEREKLILEKSRLEQNNKNVDEIKPHGIEEDDDSTIVENIIENAKDIVENEISPISKESQEFMDDIFDGYKISKYTYKDFDNLALDEIKRIRKKDYRTTSIVNTEIKTFTTIDEYFQIKLKNTFIINRNNICSNFIFYYAKTDLFYCLCTEDKVRFVKVIDYENELYTKMNDFLVNVIKAIHENLLDDKHKLRWTSEEYAKYAKIITFHRKGVIDKKILKEYMINTFRIKYTDE